IYIFKFSKNISIGFLGYLPIVIIISIILSIAQFNAFIEFQLDDYWITGRVSGTYLYNYEFFTLRTAGLEANLSDVLFALAIPYIFTRNIANIVIWGLLVYYLRKKILIKNIPLDEKLKVKKFFTNVDEFITYGEYIGEKTEFLITKNKEDRTDQPEDSREEVLNLLESLEQERLLDNLKPQEEKEIQRFYFILKYLYYNKQIEIWKPEFSLNFEQVEKQGLYLIYEDGRGLHNYEFSKETVQDPSLISGMFTAITAFIKETTKSAEVLKTIDHGDITILIEYGKHFFGALFIKGNQTSEIRSQLKEFINRFQNQHMDTLKQWTGATAPFKDTDKTIEDIFKEE
ncbi:MAG: hypothetical protein KGD63_11290, partial [Candidatus Lokiarchaeota archaeon]|nr:hypothetical protein [Candidatus Lokiarchaeota archaeon]